MQIREDKQKHILGISGALHLSEAAELRQALADWLEREPVLQLDLSEVNACDAASMQLLCSLRHSACLANKQLCVVAVSRAVAEADEALGLGLCQVTNTDVIQLDSGDIVFLPGASDGD
jgi:anti-anti-sigma factor